MTKLEVANRKRWACLPNRPGKQRAKSSAKAHD